MIASRNSSRSSRGDAGFTLVEAVVALVLVGVIAAVAIPAVGNVRSISARATASSQAEGEAKIAARMLKDDVRGAQGTRSLRDRPDLSLTHLGETTADAALSTATALTGNDPLHVDVLEAGPRQLTINADVLPTPGRERVQWVLVENDSICGDRDENDRNWCVVRRVFLEGSP